MRFALAACLLTLLAGCYENRSGCLDPNASNYDLQADESCSDCCGYPSLSVRITTVWEDSAVVTGRNYRDAAGTNFQIVRFRYYLGDMRLESSVGEPAEPLRPLELQQLIGQDTTPITLNGNYLLATTAASTITIGVIGGSDLPVDALSGSYGLPDRYRNVIPGSSPSGDALRTQPGRLNYRDGRGFVQSRLEYTLEPGGDTLSASSYGSVPFTLPFGEAIVPRQGADIRLDVQARLVDLIGRIDVSPDTAAVAEQLARGGDFLYATGFTQ